MTPVTEVLNTSDDSIPGLFVCGNATGGLSYNNYPGNTGLVNAAVFGNIEGDPSTNISADRDSSL